jgi:two-component system, NarL family, sensor kinase
MDSAEKDFLKFYIIAAALLGSIIAYYIISIIRQQRRNLQSHKEKIQAEITMLENERRRIANDLHDELGPILSAVKLHINSLETTDPHDIKLIEKSSRYIDDIIKKLREISNNLMPNTLIRKGLVFGIEEFVSAINTMKALKIQFSCNEPVALGKEKEINIYRIVQEVVHNTLKHSGATELKISLVMKEGRVQLITEDNGKGFDYNAKMKENTGLGLHSLASRAEIMGGEFELISEPGKGARCIFDIPIAKP